MLYGTVLELSYPLEDYFELTFNRIYVHFTKYYREEKTNN